MSASASLGTVTAIIALIAGILLFAAYLRKERYAASAVAFALCLTAAAIARLTLSSAEHPSLRLVLESLTTLALAGLPAFSLLFILALTDQSKRARLWIHLLLGVLPVLVLVMVLLQAYPPALLQAGTERVEAEQALLGLSSALLPVYSLGLLAAALALLLTRSSRDLKYQSTTPFFSLGIAVSLAVLLILTGMLKVLTATVCLDLLLGASTLIGIAMLIARNRIPAVARISRENLFNSFNDGLIVINNQDVILDMNPAAEQLIDIAAHRAYGSPVEMILANWKSIAGANEAREVEFRGSINLNKQWRYISVRTNRLEDGSGRVILLRDITDRKDTHEARQHAREEMFNLLRSFFKSANTSQSSNDFFRDVLFQVIYTFRADGGAICLVDPNQDTHISKFTLMANHSLPIKEGELLSTLPDALAAAGWRPGREEPIILTDVGRDQYFFRLAQQNENICVAILPLLYDLQLMGVLFLARYDGTGFQSDELVRLGVVTEELASFIYSDRKRKADIALAERHRLTQDLHDSITQKLVGLLQLTEAVKLGIESGAPVDGKRIDRISESARQALREMRLFLFELAPVNIERDGLISILQSRLASVEGRSDIQARMFADTDIPLSTQEETEIYYIVEEALNNILKHANAKAVTIKLKKRKASIYLEIVDNGVGFDPEQVKMGGKGLGNMRDRAKRINGKLKLTSSPENGTRITLVVPHNG
jgi:signal transduction histidine kinase